MRFTFIRRQISAFSPCLVAAALLVTACQPVTRSGRNAASAPRVEAASETPTQQVVEPTASLVPTARLVVKTATAAPAVSPVAVRAPATASAAAAPAPVAPTRVALASAALAAAAGASAAAEPAPSAAAAPDPALPPSIPDARFVARGVINVRAGPGTAYAILGQLAAGSAYPISGTNATRDWLQFSYGWQDGWVSAGIVQIQGDVSTLTLLKNIPAPPPDRVVAPSIKLDSKIIPVGWHVEQTASGPVEVWDVASYAAGWLINSAVPGQVGNMVLSGHHNILGEVFRYVVDLKVGDPITIYAGGTAYNYRVTDSFIVPDKYVSAQQKLDNGKWIGPFADERLTLVTCWPYTNNTHRVIVIAKPVR